MIAISDLSSTIRSEISILVAMSFFRSAMSSESAGVVAVGGSTSSTLVSMLLEAGVAWRDAISVFSCSTAVVIKERRELRSVLRDANSAA